MASIPRAKVTLGIEMGKDEGQPDALSRRSLLGGTIAIAGLTALRGAKAWAGVRHERRKPQVSGQLVSPEARRERAFEIRHEAAEAQRLLPLPEQRSNGDEEALPSRIGSFTKGLPHDAQGQVDPAAYGFLLTALAGGRPEDFEHIPLGGYRKLANPQAGLAFDLVGCDSSQLAMAPAPGLASATQAVEAVELYWQALCRDIPFAEYERDHLVAEACAELSRLSGFEGPRDGSSVKPVTVFRGTGVGDLRGPYISQFLWRDIPFVPIWTEQKIRTAVPGRDYMTSFEDWLAVQKGALADASRYDRTHRYIRSGRDLAEYVHRDFSYQSFLSATLMLFRFATPIDGGNPYKHSRTQGGFTTFGQPYVLSLLATATDLALKASWYQKWYVHRKLRPEELGGIVHNHLTAKSESPLHDDLLGSTALERSHGRYGSFVLPQAYPEGSPMHPSYPAAHAVIAGACATVLKAFFDESYEIPNPVVANPDGLSLKRYEGEPLTVGGELDKLASNVSMGRNFAGIHWRSDAVEGLRLGERVAIELLRERNLLANELFTGWSVRTFDGERIEI